MEGKIHPGRVFDCVVSLDQVPDGYRAMNERQSIQCDRKDVAIARALALTAR
jgi:hypothetical protein